jgi:hypothetical protein
MEYLVGAAITMIAYIITQKIVRNNYRDEKQIELRYSQSHIYDILRPHLEFSSFGVAPENTQSVSYLKQAYMKVMVVRDRAYWIKDNTFYTAHAPNGQVQKETTKEVDTMAMSKVELNEMLFIIEKLREESDDNRGSGK